MDEEDIKKIKEKKKRELQGGSEGEDREEMEKKMEKERKQALRKTMTSDAYERFNRVKMANPEVANQLETYLVRMSQAGQIKNKITEDKLKKILKQIQDETKQDWNIKRR